MNNFNILASMEWASSEKTFCETFNNFKWIVHPSSFEKISIIAQIEIIACNMKKLTLIK